MQKDVIMYNGEIIISPSANIRFAVPISWIHEDIVTVIRWEY